MSSILKALRKLEDEKASSGEGSVDLAHDILKRSYSEPRSAPWLLISLSCILLFVVAGGGVWLYFSLTGPESAALPASQSTQAPPAPAKQDLVLKPEQRVVSPAKEKSPVTRAVKANLPSTPVHIKTETQTKAAGIKETRGPVTAKGIEPIDIPTLRVDEIVYHKLPGSRLAVINDLPVMEGTEIEGAHVEEILPDRIRFSLKGVRFNKFLSADRD